MGTVERFLEEEHCSLTKVTQGQLKPPLTFYTRSHLVLLGLAVVDVGERHLEGVVLPHLEVQHGAVEVRHAPVPALHRQFPGGSRFKEGVGGVGGVGGAVGGDTSGAVGGGVGGIEGVGGEVGGGGIVGGAVGGAVGASRIQEDQDLSSMSSLKLVLKCLAIRSLSGSLKPANLQSRVQTNDVCPMTPFHDFH